MDNNCRSITPSPTTVMAASVEFRDLSETFKPDLSRRLSIFHVLLASTVAFHVGFAIGFSSPAMRDLENQNPIHDLQLNVEQCSWFGSILAVAALCGGLAVIPLMELTGRRPVMLLILTFLICGWIVLSLAESVLELFVGRVFTGLPGGMSAAVVPLYCGEVSPASIRGSLGTLYNIILVSGITAAYALGAIFRWRNLARFGFIFATVSFILCYLLPESQQWLMSKKCKSIQTTSATSTSPKCLCTKQKSYVGKKEEGEATQERWIYKPVLLVAAFHALQQLSGINGIMFNVHFIFKVVQFENESIPSICVGVGQMVAMLAAFVFIERLGRRRLMLISCAGACLCQIALGTCFFMLENMESESMEKVETKYDGLSEYTTNVAVDRGNVSSIYMFDHPHQHNVEWSNQRSAVTASEQVSIRWMALASSLVYIAFFAIGLGPIPFVMISEMFPRTVSNFAGGVAASANFLTALIVVKTFRNLSDAFGLHGVFWLYAGFCLMGEFITWKCLPETKGKTLSDIQKLFRPEIVRIKGYDDPS